MNIEMLADRPEFIPQIAEWYFQMWGFREENNSIELTAGRIAGKLNRKQLPVPLVALEGERILGVAQLKLREMDIFPERAFWLGGVYVAENARGRGVAGYLTASAIELARDLRIEQLWLQTIALNGGLYAKNGFAPVEKLHYKGEDVLVMTIDL